MRTFRFLTIIAVVAIAATSVLWARPGVPVLQPQRVLVSVNTGGGALVPGLTASDFVVRVGGKEADIIRVAPLAEPLSIVVVPEGFSRTIISDARNTLRAIVRAARAHHPDTRIGLMLDEGASAPTMYPVVDGGEALERQIARYFESPTSSPLLDSILVASRSLGAERNNARVILVVSVGTGFQDTLPATRIATAVYESGASLWAMDAVGARPIGAADGRVLSEVTAASGGRHARSSLASLAVNTEHMMRDIVSRYALTFEAPGDKDSASVGVRQPGLSVVAPAWPAKITGQ